MVGSRAALGSLLGAAVAAGLASLTRGFFEVPLGGVGFVTENAYPKGWDYAVIAMLVVGSAVGAWLGVASSELRGRLGVASSELRADSRETPRATRNSQLATSAVVFLAMLAIHDHPFQHMDPFHEGEHLTPAYLFQQGERPYTDVFLLHGLGVDGGLDALVGGNPLYTRRLQTVLDAATLALLVPIAAQVTATTAGMLAGVLASLCGVAALWVPVFPYFRLAPVLLAVLALLRYARSGKTGPLLLAFASATLGVVWSLDTGTYALAGTAIAIFLVGRLAEVRRYVVLASIALALPILVLLAVRADLVQFFRDSFVIIPSAIDAVWSLPAPKPFSAAGLRYYLPPVFYGLLLAVGWKRRDPRILIVIVLSLVLFRTAAGRVSWSHTRFATPLLGIAFVAFVLEPLRNRIALVLLAIAAFFYFEVPQNAMAGAKLIAEWPARQRHEGMVRHPLVPGIYTAEENATQMATLKHYVDALGPGPILDFTNERALYFLLKRKPPARAFDIPMLSSYHLLNETTTAMQANPPVAVILGGEPAVAVFDGVPNDVRVPELARWIDVTYPKRTQIGRFIVATR